MESLCARERKKDCGKQRERERERKKEKDRWMDGWMDIEKGTVKDRQRQDEETETWSIDLWIEVLNHF